MAKLAKKERAIRRGGAAKGVRSRAGAKGAKTFCPCCPTWEIKCPERCSNTLAHAGRTLFFCTRRCKEKFVKSPEAYLRKAVGPR